MMMNSKEEESIRGEYMVVARGEQGRGVVLLICLGWCGWRMPKENRAVEMVPIEEHGSLIEYRRPFEEEGKDGIQSGNHPSWT